MGSQIIVAALLALLIAFGCSFDSTAKDELPSIENVRFETVQDKIADVEQAVAKTEQAEQETEYVEPYYEETSRHTTA